MKTDFKDGMRVYDKVFFPNKRGVIININKKSSLPLVVMVEDEKEYFHYTLEGAASLKFSPTLSTIPYDFITVEQKSIVVTFEEAWGASKKIYGIESDYYTKEFGGYPSQELARATEAMRKLLFLRDYYNDGWQPNWKNKNEKRFFIEVWDIGFFEEDSYRRKRPLIFKTRSIARKFIEEQKELLEIAEPLL